ncbi:MAG TPA: hypothetical protein VHF26_14405 [Trebonia sp.]|nr:hypothetical protein [Trebonia sp.]
MIRGRTRAVVLAALVVFWLAGGQFRGCSLRRIRSSRRRPG